ncbi:MAG TPA: c-type cytochrome [Terriglobia bacterium]|nr:c-type cytochrome [Terriglobia bacterium]
MSWPRRCCGIVLGLAMTCAAAETSWIQKVPEADRVRANPYAKQAEDIAAGSRLFANYCAQCHGSDAKGRGKRPSLRSAGVQQATDGDIFWLLKNGNRRRGMPSWSSLPEPSRWQIVSYVKSLGTSSKAQPVHEPQEKPR